MKKSLGGIQQIGIGVPDVHKIWPWYRKFFGNDIKVFEEAAEAPLMKDYTGGEVHSRNALLALNMESGGGFEIWQFTSRNTEKPKFDVQLGDTGIYITRIKSRNVQAAYNFFKEEGADIIGHLQKDPRGDHHFFVKDPNGNIFNVVGGEGWFMETKSVCGGVGGAMLGVSNIKESLKLYKNVLGFDRVIYDETGSFEDLSILPGGKSKVRRMLLGRSEKMQGPFSELLGPANLELIQVLDREPKKIFQDRFWGDWGFIHLCFDVKHMRALKEECAAAGFPFTVDSEGYFAMEDAGGQFSYIEDPDGTLIEFVETHKVPLMKKIGWYINLKNRKDAKSLPKWMLKAFRFNRVKN